MTSFGRMPALAMHPSFCVSALLGTVLALAACSDGGTGQTPPAASSVASAEQAESESPDAKPEPVGSMSIDGRSYELIRSFWCEPHSGVEGGTEVVIQVGAFQDSGRLITVMGTQVDRDRDRASVQSLTAIEPDSTSAARSGDVVLDGNTRPVLMVEDGRVQIQGEVMDGGDIVPLEAEFTLPDEPGLKWHC